MSATDPILTVDHLSIDYVLGSRTHHAVQEVSFRLGRGEKLSIVGESGSGKSTIAQSLIHLTHPAARHVGGTVTFDGEDLTRLRERQWRRLRGARIGLVPQDPLVSLDPLRTVGDQVAESIRIHRHLSRAQARAEAVRLLGLTGIPDAELRASQYPHQFSGGQLQRVLIAAALAPEPELIIADEPTSALDVTVQKLILDHLDGEVQRRGISLILVTHDLAVAADRTDRVLVLQHGRVVEQGPVADILTAPQQQYTRQLLEAAPRFASRPEGAPVAATEGAAEDVAEGVADGVAAPAKAPASLLAVDTVRKEFTLGRGRDRTSLVAVDDVSLDVRPGETVALVGESGSGKSTLARIILGLERADGGRITFGDTDITGLDRAGQHQLRRRLTIVYQSPFSSLDPRMTIRDIIGEPLSNYRIARGGELTDRVVELLDQVGLPTDHLYRQPGELSGGQRQRVAIARALSLDPELIVLDEPVSALDVTVQAQILELLRQTQAQTGTAYLFISHDLAVVQQISNRVAVLNHGVLEEFDHTDRVLHDPQTDYTRRLISAIPGRKEPVRG